MPLQNRVDPFGEIHAVAARGLFTGNRGVIHDPATKTLLPRRWTTKAWIVCVCEFRGHRREAMGRTAPSGRAGWTELFFLDEVTALAAGHRPCFYCRRERATAFSRCVAAGQGRDRISAPEMDRLLHAQRLAAGADPVEVDRHGLRLLPDGAVFSDGATDFAVCRGRALPWSFTGYGAPLEFDEVDASEMCIVTPAATVAALLEGYAPVWHPSAARLLP